ncbi:MAG: PfkB family carbohydrate kinase, partial [Pseudomonadota bacterium]
LEREGVDCSAARRFQGRRSALSAVVIDARGERMIVNHTDPDLSRDPDWIAAAMPSDVSAVLADISWPEGAHAALIEARRRGAPGILDADHPIPSARDVFKAASHLAFSAQGMRAFAGRDDLATAVRDAARETGAWCCVTDGARGVLVASPGSDAVSQVSGFDVDAVDTLGAGDVWHGAFALRLAETRDESDAVRFANAAAAIKVTRPGGRRGAPNRAETDAFLETRSAGDTFTFQSRSA